MKTTTYETLGELLCQIILLRTLGDEYQRNRVNSSIEFATVSIEHGDIPGACNHLAETIEEIES